jgi:hypothetical protein
VKLQEGLLKDIFGGRVIAEESPQMPTQAGRDLLVELAKSIVFPFAIALHQVGG